MNIGKIIREKRKLIGINQGELAAKVGITKTYLSQIETTSRNPTTKILVNIARELDMSFTYLIFKSIDLDTDISYTEKISILYNIFDNIKPK